MSMRSEIEASIIGNVKETNLTYPDKLSLALNLFKEITESLEWLDFDDKEGLEALDDFKNDCEMYLK